MFKIQRAAAIALAALGLGACAGPSIHYVDTDLGYEPGEVRYATADGKAIRVETVGQVTPVAPYTSQAQDAMVARALSRYGPHWFTGGFTAGVTASREAETDDLYKVRWLFNPPLGFSALRACAESLQAEAAGWTDATGRVVAAFFRDERTLSEASGSMGAEPRPGSTTLAKLIGTMGLVLLPPRDPTRGDDCFGPRVLCL